MKSTFQDSPPNYLRLLVDHVPAMLAYWGRDLSCRFANRAYENWFGVDPNTLVGTSLKDLLGPRLFALNEPYIRAALEGREQVFERVVPGPYGTQRSSLATYVPDLVDGQVMGFVAHVTEVTKLKDTEAALHAEVARREIAMAQLRASKAALVEAQRLGGIGNWEWEIAPDIVIWSDEVYRIFGRDPLRMPPAFSEHASLYREQSWQRLQMAVSTLMCTGESYTLELEYVRADGQSGWIEARGEAVRGDAGEITKLRGTVHEITLRHRMEAIRVRVRAAEAASRNKTQLLSRVSHELRTPLNAILGFSQLLEADTALNPEHRHWAATISQASRHMQTLVDDVLDLTAAESGRIDVQHVDIDATSIVQQCVLQAQVAAQSAGVTLCGIEPDSAPVYVLGDAKRLRQIVDNLLSNAIKYTCAGGLVSVSVSQEGGLVNIAVRDNGVGMSGEQLERMFQPFDRLGAELSEVPGTGLGLALSKTLVELMAGVLQVQSSPGKGSTFTVSLRRGGGDG